MTDLLTTRYLHPLSLGAGLSNPSPSPIQLYTFNYGNHDSSDE